MPKLYACILFGLITACGYEKTANSSIQKIKENSRNIELDESIPFSYSDSLYLDYDNIKDLFIIKNDSGQILLSSTGKRYTFYTLSEEIYEAEGNKKGFFKIIEGGGVRNDNGDFLFYKYDSIVSDWFLIMSYFYTDGELYNEPSQFDFTFYNHLNSIALINNKNKCKDTSIFNKDIVTADKVYDKLAKNHMKLSLEYFAFQLELTPVNNTNIEIYYNISYDLNKTGSKYQALYILNQIMTKAPNYSKAFLLAGDIYWDVKNEEACKKYYTKYLSLSESSKKKIPNRIKERLNSFSEK
jgi:hypothetical protein